MSSFDVDLSRMTLDELLATSQPSDWRPLDPARTLYINLAAGRVIIELAPDFAPKHIDNVERLARERYWDGLAVIRVNDNYVLQIGDLHADDAARRRPFGDAKTALPAELDRRIDLALPFNVVSDVDGYAPRVGFTDGFATARDDTAGRTWLIHCYGTVSAGRDIDIDSGNGAELTVVIGHAPRQLDRNVTVIGRVRAGMELLSAMSRGNGALGFYERNDPSLAIRSVRLAVDLPEAERTPLEILRTDTAFFATLVETRRNRRDPWFHRPAGHVEIGNVPVPVRGTAA